MEVPSRESWDWRDFNTEPELQSWASGARATSLLSGNYQVRLTKELDFRPYIDLSKRSGHTPAHSSAKSAAHGAQLTISNEAEFEKLLATAMERERQRLRVETAAGEFQKCMGVEGLEKESTKETQHEDEP